MMGSYRSAAIIVFRIGPDASSKCISSPTQSESWTAVGSSPRIRCWRAGDSTASIRGIVRAALVAPCGADTRRASWSAVGATTSRGVRSPSTRPLETASPATSQARSEVGHDEPRSTTLDSIKRSLVGLRMPRALEVLDATVRRIEQGEIDGIGAFDQILFEELTLRESRRVKTALLMARLTAIKTLHGFDFAFQPSLDRNRIMALAELKFIDRAEVVHLLGPPGTGKSHLATALAVEAVKAGRSVVFSTLADIIGSLAKAERDGTLRERIRYLCRASLLVVDEIGYMPVVPGGGNLFFSPNGATSSAIPSLPRHFSIACSTTPWSSRSKAPATACGSMPTWCPSTFARKLS